MGNISNIYGGAAFDPNSVEPATGFDPLPAGWYQVEIENAEIKETKAKTGKFLHLELCVVGENYNGRKLFPNINLMNPNAKAVEIGMRELAAVGQACGLNAIADTNDLLGKMIEARVKVVSADKSGNGEPDNVVTAYRPIGATPPARTQAPANQAQQQPPAQNQHRYGNTDRPPAAQGNGAAPKRPWER